MAAVRAQKKAMLRFPAPAIPSRSTSRWWTSRYDEKAKANKTRERIGPLKASASPARATGSERGLHRAAKLSYGEGVERVFPIYSPLVDSVVVVRKGKVRRAKLYYLRGRTGKAARISERVENAGPDAA